MEDLENLFEQWKLKDFSIEQKVKEITGNGEKILAILQAEQEYYPTFTDHNDGQHQKDEMKAVALRKRGNQEFAKKNYWTSLKSYNESLCYSESTSTNISKVFASRSTAYFKLGYYETCLNNIQLALDYGYPEHLKPELLNRQKRCEDKINNQTGNRIKDPEVDINLTRKANEKIPYIVEGIELFENEVHGRGLRATRDFKVGDILIKEEPFIKSQDHDMFYTHCFWCAKSSLMNLIPCKESIMAMFCSEQCYEENLRHGFKCEAKVLNAFNNRLHNVHFLRSIVKILTTSKNIDELEELLDSCDSHKFTAFNINYENPKEVEKDKIRAFFNLANHWNHRSDADKLNNLRKCALAYYLTVECTELKRKIITDKHRITVMDMIYKIYEIEEVNAFGLQSANLLKNANDDGNLIVSGSAICLMGCLMNHSCAPNVFAFGHTLKAFIVRRPIKTGDQLYNCYRFDHSKTALDDRKNELKKCYFFDCRCVACKNNYPTKDQMLFTGLISKSIIATIEEYLNSSDMKKVEEAFKMCNSIIQEYDQHYPCIELQLVLDYQERCINLLFYDNLKLRHEPLH